MKNLKFYTLLALLLMAGGVTMQGQETNRSSYGEFYSFTGWTYQFGWICNPAVLEYKDL